jgi:hypothetical protein
MRVLNDFYCPSCDDVVELFLPRTTKEVRCKACGTTRTKRIAPVRSVLDPISGHFPDATEKWAKHHEQAAKAPKDY